jgi:hypothetical protein
MKKIIILISLLVGSSLAVFIGGFVAADGSKYHNDFVRIFPPHAADINSSLKVQPHQFYLAGASATHVYLSDRRGILRVSSNMADTGRIDLSTIAGSEINIDSPYFFVHKGSTGELQHGHINSWKIDTTFHTTGFTAFEPISSSSAILRQINAEERKNVLVKLNGPQKYVLKKQVDGLLCTDGYLQYSSTLHQLVYTYRYRNQFVCLDTNLNVVRIGKTIDTTSVAKIAVNETDGKITMSKPPLVVNNGTCVDGKYLFIRSNLLARNESAGDFKNRSVIDVYNIIDGSYRFSIYIENYEGSKMQDFLVENSTIVAMFRDALVTYDVPLQYLP